MPDFHYVHLRTFAHATEDLAKVRGALARAVGDAAIHEVAAEGSHGNAITILETNLQRAAEIRAFWARMAEGGLLEPLRAELEPRLDDEGTFYFRLAKQDACLGALALTREDDAIQVRAKPAAFPATREGARRVLVNTFEKLSGGGRDPSS